MLLLEEALGLLETHIRWSGGSVQTCSTNSTGSSVASKQRPSPTKGSRALSIVSSSSLDC